MNKQHTTQLKEENVSSTSETCFAGSMMCCGCLLILGLFAGAISYIVFGIMYLVQDYDIAHDCKDSSLWAYVLVAIILSLSRGNAKNAVAEDDDIASVQSTICTCVCLGLIESGLAIWGGIELWDKSCDDLSDSNLWTFGLVTFILQAFCGTLFLVIMPMIACCITCKNTDTEVTKTNHEGQPINHDILDIGLKV